MTFVVIAYNEEARIARTIAAIGEMAELPDYEIVVVDDGSSDSTASVVRELAAADPRVAVHLLGSNKGRGAARAAGVARSRGRYIAMVDADILLPVEWWRSCRDAIAAHDVVSGTAVPDGDVVYLADRFALHPKPVRHATATTGSNALFRREVFDLVHYEAELRNGEDVALDHQMTEHEVSRFTVPGLTVRHREDKTLQQAVRWMFESGIGASRQLERYRQVRRPDQAAFLLAGLAANALLPRRSPRAGRLATLAAGLGLAALLHVRGTFELRRGDRGPYAAAVLTDALLLASYVLGRIAGHGYVCRQDAR